MPRLRGIRSRATEIDVEVRHWSQGDLVPLPYSFTSYVPALPTTDETLRTVKAKAQQAGGEIEAPDDDILLRDASGKLWGVIVTQTCDVVEKTSTEPWFEVALVDQLADSNDVKSTDARAHLDASWRRAVAGANIARFAISTQREGVWTHDVLGEGRWFVDLRRSLPFEKGKLLQLAERGVQPERGVPAHLRVDFALRLQERRGRDELPDSVEKQFLGPLVERLQDLRSKGSDTEQAILNGCIRQIRYIVEPADRRTYLVHIFVCFSPDCTAASSPSRGDAEALLRGLVKEYSRAAVDVRAVDPRFVGASLDEMSAYEYSVSHLLNWGVRD